MRCQLRSVLAAVAFAAAACTTAAKQPELLDRVPEVTMHRRQVRWRCFQYLDRFALQVERTADRIAAASDDAQVQRNALRWKLAAIAAVQLETSHEDPAISLISTWSVVVKLHDLLAADSGRALFGAQQDAAVACMARLEAEIRSVAEAVAPGEVERTEQLIRDDAVAHPYTDLHLTSWQPEAPLVRMLDERTLDVFSVAASLEDRSEHLTSLLRHHALLTPNLVRWQAELLVRDLLADSGFAAAPAQLGQLAAEVGRIGARFAAMPEDLDRMSADLTAIREVIASAAELIATEREAAIRDLVAAVDAQREAFAVELDRQRVALSTTFRGERSAALAHVDDLVARENEVVGRLADRLLDDFWRRGAVVLGALVLGAGLLALAAAAVLLRRARPR